MRRGWYLAQGLIPLGESSSDDEGPCELPDGRLVCGPHGLVCCWECYVDFSVTNGDDDDEDDEFEIDGFDIDEFKTDEGEDDENEDNEDEDYLKRTFRIHPGLNHLMGHNLRRGSGRAFPTKFIPPSALTIPSKLFSRLRDHGLVTRYTLPNDPGKGLIRTDGACLNNGQPNPKAGWAFWHGLTPSGKRLVASGRLEKKGPFGDDGIQSSNRAELRAVIAALGFRYWPGEGFHTIVFATDSEYVVEGSTNWAKTWVENGWKTSKGTGVKNRDLWEALLGEIERYQGEGMAVEFWHIPRAFNATADAAAQEAAAQFDAPDEWAQVIGLNC